MQGYPNLMVPAFYNQVVAKLADKSCTGKRNLKISLDIVEDKCTGRFYIVGSEGFQQMQNTRRTHTQLNVEIHLKIQSHRTTTW